MEQDFDFRLIPPYWAVCSLAACGRKDECMRYQACQAIPQGVTERFCVLPTVLRQERCPRFHPIKKVRAATGLQNIFADIKERHLAPIRSELTAYLGSRASFYRCRRGELLLTPAQQEWVKKMLRRYGYTEEVRFDIYKEVYQFL